MSDGEKTRTTHVWRAKNKDDEEVWVDLERVDKVVNNERQKRIIDGKVLGSHYQKVTRTMFWADETLEFRTEEEAEEAKAAAETEDDENPHPTRKTTFLKVKNPEDETAFAPVNVIDEQRTTRGRTRERQDIRKRFVNKNVQEGEDKNETREFTVRRVFHWDTEKDPNEDYVADDPDWKERQEYVRVEGTEDRSQYVDVALIERVIQYSGRGATFQKRTFVYNTDPIKEFSEPTPEDEIDPEKTVWLDPWQNIVNVQWGGYRLVAFFMAQNGNVQFDLQFAGPKTHYTLGELNKLEREGEKVQVPVLATPIGVQTGTFSANGVYPPTDGTTVIIAGTRLAAAEPTGAPNYRGFTTLNIRDWDEDGEIKVETGEHIYYDFKWQTVDADDIPEASERGAVLISSSGVTVYVRLYTGDEDTRGVTAYDRDGNILWRIGSFFPPSLPDAVNVDRQTDELIALTYYSLPDSGNPGVEYYGLDGARAYVTDFGDEYASGDVSRKGKSYVFAGGDFSTTAGIRGLSQSGETLWTIPGMSSDDGFNWGTVTAYGEDYLLVTVLQNIPDIDDGFNPRHNWYRIYDANTGAMVSEHALSDDIRTISSVDGPPGSNTVFVTDNQESYGRNNGLIRSAYWP